MARAYRRPALATMPGKMVAGGGCAVGHPPPADTPADAACRDEGGPSRRRRAGLGGPTLLERKTSAVCVRRSQEWDSRPAASFLRPGRGVRVVRVSVSRPGHARVSVRDGGFPSLGGCRTLCRDGTTSDAGGRDDRRGGPRPVARAHGRGRDAVCRAASALARALRAGASAPARRRADELDDALGEPLPAVRREGVGGAVHLRRRPRLRRLLPRRYRRDGRPRAGGGDRGDRRAGGARHHHDAADRGLAVGRRGAVASLRPAVLAGRAYGDRRQPQRAAYRAPRSPAGPRCWSSTGATTARSTRRS